MYSYFKYQTSDIFTKTKNKEFLALHSGRYVAENLNFYDSWKGQSRDMVYQSRDHRMSYLWWNLYLLRLCISLFFFSCDWCDAICGFGFVSLMK